MKRSALFDLSKLLHLGGESSRITQIVKTCLAVSMMMVSMPSKASVSVAIPFESAVEWAEAVVVVSLVEQKSQWEQGKMFTYSRVAVEENVAGDVAVGSTVWIKTKGGRVDKIVQSVNGEPKFLMGEKSLVFIKKPQGASHYQVVGRAQGQFYLTSKVNGDAGKAGEPSLVGAEAGLLIHPSESPQSSKSLLPTKVQASLHSVLTTKAALSSDDEAAWIRQKTASLTLLRDHVNHRELTAVKDEIANAWRETHPNSQKRKE